MKEKPVLKLVGKNGNAFAILGAAIEVAKKHNMDWEKIEEEATSGDFDYLLLTLMEYFTVT